MTDLKKWFEALREEVWREMDWPDRTPENRAAIRRNMLLYIVLAPSAVCGAIWLLQWTER